MARHALLGYFDYGQVPGVTVTGGAWETNFPAANMLLPYPQLVAQATSTSTSFTINLGASYLIGLIHFQRLVTATSGTIRVQAGTYDSTTVSSWPSDVAGTYPSLLYAALGRPRIFVPPSPVLASTIDVTINAVSAPLQIGYAGACGVWEATDNFLIGDAVTIIDESVVDVLPFGSTYVTLRGKRRRLDCALPPLADNNINSGPYIDDFSTVFDFSLTAGKGSPVIAVPFPDDTEQLERRAVWGYISNDQQFTNRFFGHYDTTFQITQNI